MGKRVDLRRVRSGEAARRGEDHRREPAGSDQRRFGAEKLGDFPSRGLGKLLHVDEEPVRLDQGFHDLVGHSRAAEP